MTALDPLRRLIRSRLGLTFSEHTATMERYVNVRMRALGFSELQQYLGYLAAQQLTSDDWTELVALATNPLTYFFRDYSQLRSVVVFLQQAARDNPRRKLQIWSAGCSTGEEPYTLAILCCMHDLKGSILATDVNPLALAEARRGVYEQWSLRHVEPDVAAQFFVPTKTGDYALDRRVRASVQFAQHNLTAGEAALPRDGAAGWDLILCRNVLIYYPLGERRLVVERLARALIPGGVLFLGSSELVADYERTVRPVVIAGRQALRRTLSAPAPIEDLVRKVDREHNLPSASLLGATSRHTPLLLISSPAPKPNAAPTQAASLAETQEQVIADVTENRVQKAQALLREVVSRNPHDLAANLSLGHLYVLTGDLEAAQGSYECVQRLDPLLHEAYLGLAVVWIRRAEWDGALAALQRAVFLEPRFWASTYLLAEIAERLALPQIAARELLRARLLLEGPSVAVPLVTHPLIHSAILPRLSYVLDRLRTGRARV